MTGRRGIALTWCVLMMLAFAILSLNGNAEGVRWKFAAAIAAIASRVAVLHITTYAADFALATSRAVGSKRDP